MRTRGVTVRTTVLLVRYRFDLETSTSGGVHTELCEECRLLAYSGAPASAAWLEAEAAEKLLSLKPDGNVAPEQAQDFVSRAVEGIGSVMPRLAAEGQARAQALAASHLRVRSASRRRDSRTKVTAHDPPDVLGIYVLLPAGGQA